VKYGLPAAKQHRQLTSFLEKSLLYAKKNAADIEAQGTISDRKI
jgi:hypothetical protein